MDIVADTEPRASSEASSSEQGRPRMAIHFDARLLPRPTGEYVIWCDGMGTGTLLARSLPQAANSVFRTHVAFEKMRRKLGSVRVYSVMDGVYATTASRRDACTLICGVFSQLARHFIKEPRPEHRTMIRAAIAFGPCIHGRDLPREALDGDSHATFDLEARGSILLSPAMPLAYSAEHLAAPFGVAVDPSATSMPVLADGSDNGYSEFVFRWWERLRVEDLDELVGLRSAVLGHLSWVEAHASTLGYPADAAKRHRAMAEEVLPQVEDLELLRERLRAKAKAAVSELPDQSSTP